MLAALTSVEEAALSHFAQHHGRNWKIGLYQLWKEKRATGALKALGRKKQAQVLVKNFKYHRHSLPRPSVVTCLYYGPLS